MLILLFFFALLFFSVEQSRAADVSDLKWTTTGGQVTIDECNELASGELVIPSTIEGKPVTNPLSPPSDPVQRRLQSPPAKSKFLAVGNTECTTMLHYR